MHTGWNWPKHHWFGHSLQNVSTCYAKKCLVKTYTVFHYSSTTSLSQTVRIYYILCAWEWQFYGVKANLHWGVAKSSHARFFGCFIATRSCRAKPCTSAEVPDTTKQRKNRARLLLATPQCRLALTEVSHKRHMKMSKAVHTLPSY